MKVRVGKSLDDNNNYSDFALLIPHRPQIRIRARPRRRVVRIERALAHIPALLVSVRALRLHLRHAARAIAPGGAGACAPGPGRALEHRRRVLDERLRDGVARVVRRAVVRALLVWRVVVRERRGVTLLRALVRRRLTLTGPLRRRRVLLRRLSWEGEDVHVARPVDGL